MLAPAERLLPLLSRLTHAGVHGGRVYDALVAETARVAGLALISLDTRARPTYDAVGVEVRQLA